MSNITWSNKNTGDSVSAADINEIKSAVNSKTTNISDVDSAALMDSKDATILTTAATAAASASKAASTLTQDASNRLVSDTEKTTWNAKTINITDAASATLMDTKDTAVITAIRGGVATAGDNLAKLYAAIPQTVDESFETITYAATPTIAYSSLRPNKKITLTGNIAITSTGTSNGSIELYKFVQDGTGNRTVSIGGTSVTINPTAGSSTLVQRTYDGSTYAFDTNYTPASSGSTTIQTETNDYLTRVTAASGKIGSASLNAVDNFVARGKSFGWFSKVKECWIPLGDFAASKIKLITTTTWSFNNIVASDYSGENGYVIESNSDKYIGTEFIPDSQGLTSKNISLAFATTAAITGTNFGRILGTEAGTGDEIYVSLKEGNYSVGNARLDMSNGRQATAFVGSWGASKYRGWLNGTFQLEANSVTSAMDQKINFFRSMRGNGMQYATGSLGFYWIGQELTQAEGQDLNLAIMDLMRATRPIYQKTPAIILGDSISAGTGTSYDNDVLFGAWAFKFAQKLGLREQSNAQGSSRVTLNDDTASGAISLVNRIAPIFNMPSSCVAIMYGTNDVGNSVDTTTDGDSTLASNYYNSMKYSVVTPLLRHGHKVVLGSIPYRPDTNATKHLLYVGKIAQIAKELNIPFADNYHAFVDAGSPASFFPDSLHPGTDGHAIIAESMYQASLGRLVRRPTLDFGSIAANSYADLTVTVFNALAGMSVSVTPLTSLAAGLMVSAFVSADDTVTVRMFNLTGSAIDPASTKFNVTVFK